MAEKKKKIMLFSRDPGAANCVIPVFRKITASGEYEAVLLGKEFALASYEREGLVGNDISKEVSEISEAACAKYLRAQGVDLVITGVGSTDATERILWAAAKSAGISSACIMDYWVNYEMRFTSSDGSRVYPDVICAIDDFMKREMAAKGIPAEKIVITGQPYFETVRDRASRLTAERSRQIKQKLGIAPDEYVITFASEPVVESYKDISYWGYTEVSIFEAITEALPQVAGNKKIVCVIKLHPRNQKDIFKESLRKVPASVRVIIEDARPAQEIISLSDMVLGMSSMFLIEAALLRKPFASVQIGLSREDPFILSRQGIAKAVLSKEELVALLKDAITSAPDALPVWQPEVNASENIVRLAEKMTQHE